MRDFRMEIVRNGVPTGKLFCRSITIRFDSTSEVMRGMRMEMNADRYDMGRNGELSFDMFTDRLRPVLIEDDQETALGLFTITTATESLAETGRYYSVEAYDETMLLKQAALQNRAYFAQGSSYLDTITQLLTDCGLININADANGATLQIDREFAVGETYLSIINTLLEEINYDPVHADANGFIVLKAKEQKTTADFIYSDLRDFKLIGEIQKDTDVFKKPNVITGVLSNPSEIPITYTEVNDDAESLLSTVRRGYRVVKVIKYNNIASEAELEAAVKAEMLDAKQETETVNFVSKVEAGHEYGSTVQLATNLIEGLYTEKSYEIQIDISSARMRHTAERRRFI